MRRGLIVAALLLALTACAPSTSPGTEPATSTSSASAGTALAQVLALPVKGRAPKTGYAREQFGNGWAETDGCDTRDRVLKQTLHDVQMRAGSDCIVTSGVLADPYTGTQVDYQRGQGTIELDHMVSLSDAWQTGAQQLTSEQRVALANDPLNLQPTTRDANQAKSGSDAASWLPPNDDYRCTFIARQAAVKTRYRLWVTSAEQAAMVRVLESCPGQPAAG